MALRFLTTFPIFVQPTGDISSSSHLRHLPTEIRFSRWNNANAQPFEARRRAQQEIEDDIRRQRRFQSADSITATSQHPPSTPPPETTTSFRSTGTPSAPSKPSIPGRKSKYSKNPATNSRHPADAPKTLTIADRKGNVAVTEDGVSYKLEGVPFELMYSYTETPKVKPIALREAPYSPFGPMTMDRPWTGKAPLPPSKKKLKEFDSFVLPPPHKKGVKPVQSPGPFLPGSGPKYVRTREEILGEPLTREEINDMVESCIRTSRQLNIGRDGVTHNMLDNIHAHWKRRRVCKIKCKGVCTVDMDNVKQQLEDKTGGKIIYERGGVLFLFRGRNYNHRTRPRFPLMLWKPVTPVYPRLVKRVPDGLTMEEAVLMRKKGRTLIPICKLGKNGVYKDLVNHVREAFEACELVRINCQGMNGSDYRKIGAKLKELVPCVLVSFENEHILMWRGREWKSSLLSPEVNSTGSESHDAVMTSPLSEAPEISPLTIPDTSVAGEDQGITSPSNPMGSEDAIKDSGPHVIFKLDDQPFVSASAVSEVIQCEETKTRLQESFNTADSELGRDYSVTCSDNEKIAAEEDAFTCPGETKDTRVSHMERSTSMARVGSLEPPKLNDPIEAVKLLWQNALEQGRALLLEDAPLDADIVHGRAVLFSQSAPPGPVFMFYPRRAPYIKSECQEATEMPQQLEANDVDNEAKEEIRPVQLPLPPQKRSSDRKSIRSQINKEVFKEDPKYAARGTLGVDELAKLLA
uniref:CRM domain-containing protein n=1 Tax=Kalanchoe fedtschenkoi TaxID=63787 RepID=A0A7N0ZWH6_KALFE